MMPRMITRSVQASLFLCLLFLAGCATPVGVKMVSPIQAYRDANANPLNAGVASDQTKYVLTRYHLLERFEKDPAAAIAELHDKALRDDRRDILSALAEASYLYGIQLLKSLRLEEQRLAPDYFLLSAFYAYYFLTEERSEPRPTAFDRRGRNAVDMYNFGLWQGFATGPEGALVIEAKTRKLPVGQVTISLDPTAQFPWKIDDFEKFEPAEKYAVRGVSVRNRTPGVGLPLIGIKKVSSQFPSGNQMVPVTAFMRIQANLASLSAGTATAALELYSPQDTGTILLNNQVIPLETDLTTPMAYGLEGSDVWDFGISAFLGKEIKKYPDGLYMTEPYRPGKIPVVFVHGTASSPVWWTEMFNTLRFDPLIRLKYQFWYLIYTSNKAIVISAADLRDALREKVTLLDPKGEDPALQQMVVIGHSQGGLLTKLTAVDMGDRLVQTLTGQNLDSLEIPEKFRADLSRYLQIKPLPFVKRVVFLSTPHRGSFRSKWWNRNLVRSIISLPANILRDTLDIFDYMTDDMKKMLGGKKTFITSADGMSPENPMLKTLVEIPLAPWVKGHSIIAVKGDGDPKLGDDGVVEYTSAHIEGMESEFIVRSDHSSQLQPLAIDEVRRILVEHLHAASREMVDQK